MAGTYKMTPAQERILRHFLRLNYPVEVVVHDITQVTGRCPDLEGCTICSTSIETVLRLVDLKRQVWLRDCVEAGDVPPLPNNTQAATEARHDGEEKDV